MNSSQSKDFNIKNLMIFFSLLLIIYVFIRAYFLSFTIDEAISFSIINGNTEWESKANNHVLNTFLMATSKALFGNNELALRLPNVLSFILYLVGLYNILKFSKDKMLLLLVISLAVLNPFLLEFFSLARGYGLATGFFMMSLFFFIKQDTDNYLPYDFFKDFILSMLFASMAMHSNLTLINFFISLMVVFSIKYLIIRKKKKQQLIHDITFFTISLAFLLPLFWGIKRLLLLKKIDELYYGAPSFNYSAESIINASLYFSGYPSWIITIIKNIILLLFGMGILSVIIKKEYNSSLTMMITLIIVILVELFSEHWLFSAKFPLERTALFYIPLLSVYVYFLFQHLFIHYKFNKWIYNIFIGLSTVILLINFFKGINFEYTKTWRFDSHTKDAMKIVKHNSMNLDRKLSISCYPLFSSTIDFYINIWNLNIMPAIKISDTTHTLNSDFVYRLDDNSAIDNFKVISTYNDINSNLLMNINTKQK